MAIYLEIDGRRVELAIKETKAFLENKTQLYKLIGRSLRDYVKQTITIGGRPTPWAPLAKSTRDKTGRVKPFIGLRDNIAFTSNPEEVVVFLDRPQIGWSIKLHARGFIIPARRPVNAKVMHWQSRGTNIFTKYAKESHVPARNIFPSISEGRKVIQPVINDWINQHVKKTWQ